MPAFGYTAPTISKAEETAERDALTTEERQLLHDEIYGRDFDDDDDDHLALASSSENHNNIDDDDNNRMMTRDIAMVHQAIDALDEPDKVAYLQALEQVPDLVQRESSLPAFWRATQGNAWAAARRVVDYWSTRKLLFGPHRAFLPLTLDGAMQDDVPYLEQGFVLVLPQDQRGRRVVFIDRVRCTPDVVPREAVLRCWFYTLQTLSETVVNQRRGYVVLCNYRDYDLYRNYDRIMTKRFLLCVSAMPIVLKASHICTGAGASVTDLIMPVFKYMIGKDNRLRLHIHCGSQSELLQDLSEFGLTKDHVACFFQGKHGNAALAQPWLAARRQMENEHRGEEEPVEESQANVFAAATNALDDDDDDDDDDAVVAAATHGQ